MASLVLGFAGQFIGASFGPLGAAIGWSIGSFLGNLIDPQRIDGPRRTDLKLQGSQYGAMIPIYYGNARGAGQVIWQTDLVEQSDTQSGKGGPKITTYSYTASFAVLLCDCSRDRPIIGVRRIWADGRLVHDTTSADAEVTLPFTLYRGTENQLPDPTMEAHLGAGNVPAHRGIAYVVFTDLPMGEFGDRIPNLEFEIIYAENDNAALHRVKEVHDAPSNFYAGLDNPGGKRPSIVRWPISGSTTIRIVDRNGSTAYEFDADDLSHVSTGSKSVDDTVAVEDTTLYAPVSGLSYPYAGVGLVKLGGVDTPLWVRTSLAVGTTNENPAVAAGTLFLNDGEFPETANNILYAGGVPDGVYVCGIAIAQNRSFFTVFTGPNANDPDNWYRLREGVVEASGTVASGITAQDLGFGSHTNASFIAIAAENNGRWYWSFNSGDAGVKTHWINDAGVLVYSSTAIGPDTSVTGIGLHADGSTFLHASLRILKDGFLGWVGHDSLVVFSRFPLGQRLTTPLSTIVADICERCGIDGPSPGGYDVSQLTVPVDGYVITQQASGRVCLEQLRSAFFFDGVESDEQVKFVMRGGAPVVSIPDDDLAAAAPEETPPPLAAFTRLQEEDLPAWVSIRHVDVETDYQAGEQHERRQVTRSTLIAAADLPIALTPQDAKRVAQVSLRLPWLEREPTTFFTTRKYAYLEPTDVITVQGRELRITKRQSTPGGIIKWDAVPSDQKIWATGATSSSGSGFSQTLPSIDQATDLVMMDIPLVSTSDQPFGFYVAMAGKVSTRWPGAVLMKSSDGGTNYAEIGGQQRASIIGRTTTALASFAGGAVFDSIGTVNVEMTAGSADLSNATQAQVLNGSNTALVGAEIVRFTTATLIGTRQYRLSGLLRGLRGTEWAMETHVANETFAILPATDYAMSIGELNVERDYKAVTLGTSLADAANVGFRNSGVRLRPFAPVHLGGGVDENDGCILRWTRRSRLAEGALNGVVPLGEDSESYVVEIWNAAFTQCARVVTGITTTTYTYTSAMQVADFGAEQSTLYFSVGQIGAVGLGKRAYGSVPGPGVSSGNPITPVEPYQSAPPPPAGGTADERHYANFATVWGDGSDLHDRRLAYRYCTIANGINGGWYARYQPAIRRDYFGGDQWALALWVQDSEYNLPALNQTDFEYLYSLAVAAGS